MLAVEDLTGTEEALTEFKQYGRTRKINGEQTINMTVVPSENNEHAFPLVQEESKILHGDDAYVLKKVNEKAVGKKTIKRVDGIHKFYVDMINKQQPSTHSGSMTFSAYMDMVFENTGYTWLAEDTFYAEEFDNLGNDNRLSLLQKGLDRYQAEMELVGTQVRFKKQIGNATDFQFRYGHNIKTIDRKIDSSNLATVIHGTGADGIEVTYRSDNADIFGEIDAPPVNDERFTSEESLLEEMKDSLQDTPEVSITIDFADLRAAGYPYTVPNEGDRVFVIYEPMDDLEIETRIMEIKETFDADLKPIKTTVTLSNYNKTFAGTMFDNVQKQMRKITNDDGVVKYDVLDEAVRIATEAMQSARTELEFNNGILAIDKDDPNRVVLFNSAGIGISDDGGQTFDTAMTGDGIVADVITAGVLRGIILEGNEVYGGMFETSDDQYGMTRIRNGTVTQTGRYGNTRLSRGQLELYDDNDEEKIYMTPGDIQIVDGKGNFINLEIISGGSQAGQTQMNGLDYLEVEDIRVLGEITYDNGSQAQTLSKSSDGETNNLITEFEDLKKRVEELENAQ